MKKAFQSPQALLPVSLMRRRQTHGRKDQQVCTEEVGPRTAWPMATPCITPSSPGLCSNVTLSLKPPLSTLLKPELAFWSPYTVLCGPFKIRNLCVCVCVC